MKQNRTERENFMSVETLRLIKVTATLEPAFRTQLMKSPLHFLQAYDLTDDEKQDIILPHFGWLVQNQLAALSYPESDDAFILLHKIGIKVLLNLAEAPLPVDAPTSVGLLTVHIPIIGFTTPTLDQVQQGIAILISCLHKRMPVAVHCVAGLGRTGTMLACYLVWQGIPPARAISTIRSWRSGSIEVPEQETIVHEYAYFIKTHP